MREFYIKVLSLAMTAAPTHYPASTAIESAAAAAAMESAAHRHASTAVKSTKTTAAEGTAAGKAGNRRHGHTAAAPRPARTWGLVIPTK